MRRYFAQRLETTEDQVYAVSAGTRPTNIPIRLTQGGQASRETLLGLCFVKATGRSLDRTSESTVTSVTNYFTTKSRGKYEAALIIIESNGSLTPTALIYRKEESQVVEKISNMFPGIKLEHFGSGSGQVTAPVFDQPIRECALSKSFLILTGLSGSGKTRLAQKFAASYTPKTGEGDSHPQRLLVAVGPDWNSRDPLLGYPDGLHSKRYLTTPPLEVIRRANASEQAGENKPYFLILDEMNLSQVERYLADFLSAMESETRELHLYEGPARFSELPENGGEPDEKYRIEKTLSLPQNLFIIGTVNVDETTYQFSPKVLDRANVIDFKMDEEAVDSFFRQDEGEGLDEIAGSLESEAEAFVSMAKTPSHITTEWANRQDGFRDEMRNIFLLLQEFDEEFGYRTLKEASRYLYFCAGGTGEQISTEDYSQAMDEIILQKILPKLHGSRGKLEGLLRALTYYCGTRDREDIRMQALEQAKATSPSLEKMNEELGGETAHYEGSYTKLCKMCRKLAQNSFVSFAEA